MRDNPWRRLVTYLLTTFAITWICWGATALLVHFTSLRATDIPAMALFVLGGFGPTIAACVCLPGGFSWKNLAHFLTRRAPHAALYFLLCALLEVAAFWLSSHGWSAPADSAGTSLIAIVSIFLVVTLVAGGNEEWGWRGIMQPLLARRFHNFYSARPSSGPRCRGGMGMLAYPPVVDRRQPASGILICGIRTDLFRAQCVVGTVGRLHQISPVVHGVPRDGQYAHDCVPTG